LLEFLKTCEPPIPVCAINIGPVHRKDVMRASVMLEHQEEFAVILAFDVKVDPDARAEATKLGVRIMTADIIYHLFEQFTQYIEHIRDEKRKASLETVVWPCVVKILPEYVFNKRDPIVVGCEVVKGTLRLGTPIAVPSKGGITLGRVTSLERDKKAIEKASAGDQVAVKITPQSPDESARMFGRHFDEKDLLMSKISRKSIDILREFYAAEVTKEDKLLIVELKKVFQIE